MAGGNNGATLREVHRLFEEGTVSGLSETQLLERFLVRRDEVAFEALVSRHGPMVLGVCRRLLRDPHAIDDAFQATFLILVRKARALRAPQLLGPWLYGVAYRVALRSRSVAARRSLRETPYIESAAAPDDDLGNEIRPVIDEELSRLPERYREAIVLCYLEGHTHHEAAERLRCPVGTVRSRLARGREQLRHRLTRRGLAPAGLVAAEVLSPRASAAVPPVLLHSTVAAATRYAAGKLIAAGVVSASAAALTQGVLTTMFLAKLKIVAVALLALGLTGGGARFLTQYGALAAQAPGRPGAAEPPKEQAAPQDDVELLRGVWQITEMVPKNASDEWLVGETWTFQGSKLTIGLKNFAFRDKDGSRVTGDAVELSEVILLDQQATPKRMSISPNGSDGNRLLSSNGIYRLEGDHLRVRLNLGKAEFPADFSSKNPGISLVLKRQSHLKGEAILPPSEPNGEVAQASLKNADGTAPAEDDLLQIQGPWTITETVPKDLIATWDTWRFQGLKLMMSLEKIGEGGVGSVSTHDFKLDPRAIPKRVTISQHADGRTLVSNGIYQLKGDDLRILLSSKQGEPAPADFSDQLGNRSIVFKRQSHLKGKAILPPSEPNGEVALAQSFLQRAEERLDWSRRMLVKGYVSKTQVLADEGTLQRAKFALEQAQTRSKAPDKPGAVDPAVPDAPVNPEEPMPASAAIPELGVRLKLARMQLERYEELYKARAIPLSILNEMRFKVPILEAQIDSEQERLSDELELMGPRLEVKRAELRVAQFQSQGQSDVKKAELREVEVRMRQLKRKLDQIERLKKEPEPPKSK